MVRDVAYAHDLMGCLVYLLFIYFEFITTQYSAVELLDRSQTTLVEIEIRSSKHSHPAVSNRVCEKPTRLCNSSPA